MGGFMTPERKKKLRLLLRKKAAEELKKEQERKAAERRKVIDERCGLPKDLDNASEDQLKQICKEYFDRMYMCESQKYDMEFEVRKRGFEINELNIAVNDLRGKFIKPTLKKVSKYENKFAKLQKKAAEFNFRNQLKTVKKRNSRWTKKKAPGARVGMLVRLLQRLLLKLIRSCIKWKFLHQMEIFASNGIFCIK